MPQPLYCTSLKFLLSWSRPALKLSHEVGCIVGTPGIVSNFERKIGCFGYHLSSVSPDVFLLLGGAPFVDVRTYVCLGMYTCIYQPGGIYVFTRVDFPI